MDLLDRFWAGKKKSMDCTRYVLNDRARAYAMPWV